MRTTRSDGATVLAVLAALAWWALLAALVLTAIVAGWRYITTDHAVYELETGEYLHCTPQGGNDLACTVTHRKDNQ